MNRTVSTSSSLPREQKAEARVASLQDGASWRPAIGLGLATLLLAGAVYAGIATGFAGLAYPTQRAACCAMATARYAARHGCRSR